VPPNSSIQCAATLRLLGSIQLWPPPPASSSSLAAAPTRSPPSPSLPAPPLDIPIFSPTPGPSRSRRCQIPSAAPCSLAAALAGKGRPTSSLRQWRTTATASCKARGNPSARLAGRRRGRRRRATRGISHPSPAGCGARCLLLLPAVGGKVRRDLAIQAPPGATPPSSATGRSTLLLLLLSFQGSDDARDDGLLLLLQLPAPASAAFAVHGDGGKGWGSGGSATTRSRRGRPAGRGP
jgi:hypothetical protein